MDTILSDFSVSVTELKRNYANILKQADDGPVAGLPHLNNSLKDFSHSAIIPSSQFTHLFDTQMLRLS
uniref:Uncharacterized protein n=2 Tax=Candidatus Kentrum sp. FW TaxID=2126338 RepID=A0A450SIQ2_9GAMM|nr:MAG: hypothetical protein BECKFW1821A_GA0114235_104111 [Candidatus Kentron sp. FW]